MTNDQILDKAHLDFVTQNGISSIHTKEFPGAYKEQAIIAMDEYSKQQAIVFTEWKEENGWWSDPVAHKFVPGHVDMVWSNDPASPQEITTGELYGLFLEHQTKQEWISR